VLPAVAACAGAAAIVAGAAAAVARPGDASPRWVPESAVEAAAAALASRMTVPVSVSPGGRYLLVKSFGVDAFELRVIERASGRVVARHRAGDSQVAPAWRPDGRALAFFTDRDGDGGYRPYLLRVEGGSGSPLPGPATRVPRAAWSAGGELAYLVEDGAAPARVVAARPGRRGARTLLADVARDAGFAWSPDGRRMAGVPRALPGFAMIGGAPANEAPRLLPLAAGGEVRELAWSPRGDAIAATVRVPGEPWWGVARMEVASARVWRHPGAGVDLSSPAFLPDGSLAYQAETDAGPRLWICAPAAWERGATNGAGGSCADAAGTGAVLSATTAAGDTLYLVRFSPIAPPRPEAVARASAVETPVAPRAARPGPRISAGELAPGAAPRISGPIPVTAARGTGAGGASSIGAERIVVPGEDGVGVPAYLWRAARRAGRAPAAVVRVHGGPALQASPRWDVFVERMLACGVDVILPDYRGSTGHGAAWEHAPAGDEARAADVRAARDYAMDRLGVAPGRVVMLGHSYGAELAARAARDPRGARGGLVLVSLPPGRGAATGGPAPARVAVFHGRNDALQGPRAARARAAALLGRTVPLRVFGDEGHAIHHLRAWAEVYSTALRFARPEGC